MKHAVIKYFLQRAMQKCATESNRVPGDTLSKELCRNVPQNRVPGILPHKSYTEMCHRTGARRIPIHKITRAIQECVTEQGYDFSVQFREKGVFSCETKFV